MGEMTGIETTKMMMKKVREENFCEPVIVGHSSDES